MHIHFISRKSALKSSNLVLRPANEAKRLSCGDKSINILFLREPSVKMTTPTIKTKVPKVAKVILESFLSR